MKILKVRYFLLFFMVGFIFSFLVNSADLLISNAKSTYTVNLSIDVTSVFEKSESSIYEFNQFMGTNLQSNKIKIENIQIVNVLDSKILNENIFASSDYANVLKILKNPFISIDKKPNIVNKIINSLIIAIFISILMSGIVGIVKVVLAKIVAFRGEVPDVKLNNHLLSLNFFRFIAAILVVVYHMAPTDWHTKYWFTNIGSQMVTFFFVLSGFVMVVSHYNRKKESALEFYRLRFARIYPLYLVVLLILIDHAKLIDVFLSIFMLQAFIPGHCLSINVPAWSLSVEGFFYLIFPLLLICYRKKSFMINIGLVISAFGIAFCLFRFFFQGIDYQSNVYHQLLGYFPLVHLCSFILGNFVGIIYLNNAKYRPSRFISNVITFTVVFWVICDLKNSYSAHFYGLSYLSWSSIVYSFSFAALIISFAIFKNSILIKLLQNKLCIRLGDLSYSIYLLQSVAYGKLASTFSLFFDSNAVKFFVPLFLLIGMSYFTYMYIEIPMKKLMVKKRF